MSEAFESPTHKFKLGQNVKLFLSVKGAAPEGVVHEVTRLLPSENNEFQYRIRAVDGRNDRVVLESQLK